MPKHSIWIIIVFLIFHVAYGSSQGKSFDVPDYSGEIIIYNLKYGIFHIGVASISFLTDSSSNSILIIAKAKTTGWIRIFKDLSYVFESSMNPYTGLPNRAVRNLKDGKYEVYNELIFDRHSHEDSTVIISQLSGTHVVPKGIYDILTGFFHFRKECLTRD